VDDPPVPIDPAGGEKRLHAKCMQDMMIPCRHCNLETSRKACLVARKSAEPAGIEKEGHAAPECGRRPPRGR